MDTERDGKCQVAVVGSGPGGATAAFFLAGVGVDVLLLDRKRFPRDKPCGDAQIRSIHPLFREMGVFDEIRRHARILHGAGIGAPSGRFHRFAVPDREIFCTPRRIVDEILHRAALSRGARFLPEFTATALCMGTPPRHRCGRSPGRKDHPHRR
jgi:flavin-dependent dehydrogenase